MHTATHTDHPNAKLALRLLEAFGADDEAGVLELLHPDYVDHAPLEATRGPAAAARSLQWVASTFADREELVEDVVATEDRVVVRCRFSAAQVGEVEGLAPTGRRFSAEQVHIWRVQDGLLAEHWMVRDDLGMLRQLGAGR